MVGEEPINGRNTAHDLASLSARERDVLSAALEGLTARAIASRLSLTDATGRSHLSAIYSKFGVAGRVELMARFRGTEPLAMSDQSSPPTGGKQSNQSPANQRRLSARALVATLSLGVAIFVVAVFTVSQLALPRQTDLANVSQLIASNAVEKLNLSGSTLTVTEKSGELLRVESVSADEFQGLEPAAVDASVADPPEAWMLQLGTALYDGAGTYIGMSGPFSQVATSRAPLAPTVADILIVVDGGQAVWGTTAP